MSDSRRLAQELYEIRALALSHATSPQLGVSSIDGEGLVLRDGDGNDIGRIGGGENGMEVEYLYGPKPPQPSAPDVSADTNLISVRWDGLWADQSETDPDIVGSPVLDRVEVHVSSDENFVPDQIESLAGTMPVLDSGGQILVGPLAEAGDWYVVLLARGKDGQYGAPSDRVHVVTSVGLVENELFDLALRAGEAMESADGKNSVYYGDTAPEPQPRLDEDGEPVLDDDGEPLFSEFTEGDIWFGPGNMPHVWSDTDGWVSAADERVDAIQSAVEDLGAALDDVIVGAGMKSFYRGTMPTVEESSEGDLWFDVSDEYHPYRFTDGEWVSVLAGLADGSVTTEKIAKGAITAESGIIGSLDAGKITVGEMDGARIKAGSVQADLVLIEGSVGSTLIADGAVTTDKLLAGAVTTEKITAGGIDAGVITTGELRGELIRAESIAASALAATAIDGKTITGATVRTAAAGARVEMDSTGLYVKNQFGTNTVSMQNGTISVEGGTITGGTIRTSTSGARVQLDVTGLKAFNPSGEETFTVSANTGTVDMLGNLRQVNTWGDLRVGPTVFVAGEDGRGSPGIAMQRKSPLSGMNQAGLALREASSGGGSFMQLQGEGGNSGWSYLNLASPDSTVYTGLFRHLSSNSNNWSGLHLRPDGSAHMVSSGASAYVRATTANSSDAKSYFRADTNGGLRAQGDSSYLSITSDGNAHLWSNGGTAEIAASPASGGSARAYVYSKNSTQASVLAGRSGQDYVGVGYGGGNAGTQGIYLRTPKQLTMYANGSKAIDLREDSTSAFFQSNTIYYRTYSSAANLYITGSQVIGRSTSARRYKLDEAVVPTEDYADALLSVPFKSWVDKEQKRLHDDLVEFRAENPMCPIPEHLQEAPDELPRHIGAVAEDFVDAGLGEFVTYDQYGRVDGLQYDRIGPALIPIVRGLRDRINELEEKIGEWENG